MMDDSGTPRPFGRLYVPDERDRLYPLSLASGAVPSDGTRHWYVPGPVLDQHGSVCSGYHQWCVGAACRNFLSAAPLVTTAGPTACTIYLRAKVIDHSPTLADQGTSIRAGLQVLKAAGRLGSYLWASTVDEARTWLLTQGTVIVGSQWLSGMADAEPDGFMKVEGQVVGGHAYLLVGYSARRESFRVLNSWGRSWGQRGRAWIRANDLSLLLRDHGEMVTAIEQRVGPATDPAPSAAPGGGPLIPPFGEAPHA